MQIRKAVLGDADAIYRFICALEEKQMDKTRFDECYAYNVDEPRNYHLVAEENGIAVGYLSCHGQFLLHHAGWVYEIQELYIEDEHRGKGIGKLLLQELERLLAATDYDVLEVSSNVERRKAHGFYLQNGFEQTHIKFVKKKA
jgi:PhnO protein